MWRKTVFLAGLLLAVSLAAPARAVELPGPLVTRQWLESRLGEPDLVVLDIRNAIDGGSAESYAEGHIPGAIYSNYLTDGWRITRDGVIGMAPPPAELERLIGGLGIGNEDAVVLVYGGVNATDFGSAARIYWTFKYLGHDRVAILDGGWRGWQAAGLAVEQGVRLPEPTRFEARVRPEYAVDTAFVEAAVARGGAVFVDARPATQYVGKEKHRAAKAYGHLPGAWSVPQEAFFDPATGGLRSREELLEVIPPELLAMEGTIVAYCNTGHWAATDWFVLHEILGREQVRLYDASMVGWTRSPERPIETGTGIMGGIRSWVERFLES